MKLHNRYDEVPMTKVQSMTLIAMFCALMVSSRVFFVFIPNVQPVTTLIILCTLLMGIRYGVIETILVIVLSNLLLGFGIWTFGQLIGYVVIVLLTGCFIRPFFEEIPFWFMVIFSISTGFIYGFIQAMFQIPFFGLHYFVAYYSGGLLFDVYHAIGNAFFYCILAPTLLPLLDKLFIRYSGK